jgi:hypothetical protein
MSIKLYNANKPTKVKKVKDVRQGDLEGWGFITSIALLLGGLAIAICTPLTPAIAVPFAVLCLTQLFANVALEFRLVATPLEWVAERVSKLMRKVRLSRLNRRGWVEARIAYDERGSYRGGYSGGSPLAVAQGRVLSIHEAASKVDLDRLDTLVKEGDRLWAAAVAYNEEYFLQDAALGKANELDKAHKELGIGGSDFMAKQAKENRDAAFEALRRIVSKLDAMSVLAVDLSDTELRTRRALAIVAKNRALPSGRSLPDVDTLLESAESVCVDNQEYVNQLRAQA